MDGVSKKSMSFWRSTPDFMLPDMDRLDEGAKALIAGVLLTQISDANLKKIGFRQLLRLASQGETIACSIVGSCYMEGNGVRASLKRAVKWLTVAAEAGFAGAQFNLGLCHFDRDANHINYEQAWRWFSAAAENRLPEAACNLGYMLWKGLGVEIDIAKAKMWLRRSFRLGSLSAAFNLGLIYEGVNAKPSRDYVAASNWYRRAATRGHAGSQCNLGIMYVEGRGVRRSKTVGLKWLKRAAKAGDMVARKCLIKLDGKNL